MPVYEYFCPQHGTATVQKPMAEASREEYCLACYHRLGRQTDEVHYLAWREANEPMKRVYSGQAFIMRPDGYSLKPGDRGYWNLNRQAELGQLRGPSATQNKHIDASLLRRPPPPKLELSDSQMRDIRNVGEIVDREIRDGNVYIPETFREHS